MKGIKNDKGKLCHDLAPVEIKLLLDHLYTLGANKYAPDNWKKGFEWSRIISALDSHLIKWKLGEAMDTTDGQHHLTSVIWCATTLLYFELYGIGKDTRGKKKMKEFKVALKKLGYKVEDIFPKEITTKQPLSAILNTVVKDA